jgi:hypothetical protein
MLNAIDQDVSLLNITRRSCVENNVGIDICDALLVDGDLNDDLIRILKIDDYYSSKNFAKPPKSIDCLIVVKSEKESFELTLVELRDVKSIKGVRPGHILEKFRNTFARFMTEDFSEIFSIRMAKLNCRAPRRTHRPAPYQRPSAGLGAGEPTGSRRTKSPGGAEQRSATPDGHLGGEAAGAAADVVELRPAEARGWGGVGEAVEGYAADGQGDSEPAVGLVLGAAEVEVPEGA